MVVAYLFYIAVMYFNPKLEKWSLRMEHKVALKMNKNVSADASNTEMQTKTENGEVGSVQILC